MHKREGSFGTMKKSTNLAIPTFVVSAFAGAQ
jgi:hypothetical protein